MYLSLNRQRQNAIYLLVLYNKKVKIFFAKISFVGQQGTLFDVIMIYTKQSTPLAVDNSDRSRFSTNEKLAWTMVII